MKVSLFSVCFLISLISFTGAHAADEANKEFSNIEQVLGALKLEKKQVELMVDKMVESGRISLEDGSKAKRELASMNDNDLENLKAKAIVQIKNKQTSLDH